jgi:hypothetical protein
VYMTATPARWAVQPDPNPAAELVPGSRKPSPRTGARGLLSVRRAYMTVAVELVAVSSWSSRRGPWSSRLGAELVALIAELFPGNPRRALAGWP